MGNIIVSVSLLTAGKKKELEKCLLSLQPLLQAVSSELIVVDTGCDAEHRSLVEQYADKVVDFVWCDDFAKARNAGLELAKGEWFLYLDDDEWFEDVSEIVEFFRTGEYKNYDYALYNQRNYKDRAGEDYNDAPVGRAVRLRKDVRFQYTIHEAFNHTGERVKFFDTYVHHYGYVYDTEEDKLRHAERNIVPLLREMEREPDNLRHPLQLMQEYAVLKEHRKVIDLGRRATENFEDGGSPQIFYYNSIAVLLLKEIIQEANAAEKAAPQPAVQPAEKAVTQPADKAIAQSASGLADKAAPQSADAREMLGTLVREGKAFLQSDYISPLAEAYIKALLVFGCRECGEYDSAIRYTEDYLKHLAAYKKDKGEYIMFLSPITEPCFGKDTRHATLENGIMAALMEGHIRQAREWNEQLGWEGDGEFHISELFLTTALDALWCAAPKEREDAEAMCNLLLTRGVVADFIREYAGRRLRELSAEDARERLAFLAGLSLREWFCRQNEDVRRAGLAESAKGAGRKERKRQAKAEGGLQAAMLEYAKQQLSWGKLLQEAARQRRVPYLESDAYLAAVAVRSFYSLLEQEKYGEAAAGLRELLRRKPDWQEAIRCCAALLQSASAAQGEASAEKERMQRGMHNTNTAQSAENAEFAALAEAVKQQVRVLLQSGCAQEAREILLQLQAMLPEDEEVKALLRKNC